jgi:hypothetical protein
MSTTSEMFNIKILDKTHVRLKVISALRKQKLQETVDEALNSWLDRQEVGTQPDQATGLRDKMEGRA